MTTLKFRNRKPARPTKRSRGAQWYTWHVQLESKVRAGEYSQEAADDFWIYLHDVMNGPRGLYYYGA